MMSYVMIVVSLHNDTEMGYKFLSTLLNDYENNREVIKEVQETVTDLLTKNSKPGTLH